MKTRNKNLQNAQFYCIHIVNTHILQDFILKSPTDVPQANHQFQMLEHIKHAPILRNMILHFLSSEKSFPP